MSKHDTDSAKDQTTDQPTDQVSNQTEGHGANPLENHASDGKSANTTANAEETNTAAADTKESAGAEESTDSDEAGKKPAKTPKFTVVYDDDPMPDILAGDDAESDDANNGNDTDAADTTDDSDNDGDSASSKSVKADSAETGNKADADGDKATATSTDTSTDTADPEADEAYAEELDSFSQEAEVLLRSYPALSFDHVTLTDQKTGRNLIDNAQWAFEEGNLYALTGADDAQRRAFLATASGFARPDSGQVMVRSASLAGLEAKEIRGHRIGLITQRFSIRSEFDALQNLEYAMRASDRTFLKPIGEIAHGLLKVVGFDQAVTGVPASAMSEVNRRRVAIARAISCDAGVIIADDPAGGLNSTDRDTLLTLLSHLAHTKDPKRCIVMLTDDSQSLAAADHQVEFGD